MTGEVGFRIQSYKFKTGLPEELEKFQHALDFWPMVYILASEDGSPVAYVGETADTIVRMARHLNTHSKKQLRDAYFIYSDQFNKSVTLHLEADLIEYIGADKKFKMLNGNVGLVKHNYYQKNDAYKDLFKTVWLTLKDNNLVKHSIEYISNSDLFKYSPYKKLDDGQKKNLITTLEALIDKKAKRVVMQGGSGTGKSVLAIFLFKLLHTDIDEFNFGSFGDEDVRIRDLAIKLKQNYPNPKAALVIPMTSFRKTIENVFRFTGGLKANMVIGPSEVVKAGYDLVIVDEAHRLRQRKNLTSYEHFDKMCSLLEIKNPQESHELDWILKSVQKAVFFYDRNQTVRPTDVDEEVFDRLISEDTTWSGELASQFRIKGGKDYVTFVDKLFAGKLSDQEKLKPPLKDKERYDFRLFDDVAELMREIRQRNSGYGLARLVAGFAWKWNSKTRSKKRGAKPDHKNDSRPYDITIGSVKLRWNTVDKDWINSENAIDEVGCIHTVQGYDLNYAGVIFGNDIAYDPKEKKIIIQEEHYHDKYGKQTIKDPEVLKTYIINIYKTLMFRGIRGTYVYACDKNLRKCLAEHIDIFTASEEQLPAHEQPVQIIPLNQVRFFEDLKAAAGEFSLPELVEGQDENQKWVNVPSDVRVSDDLFACRVMGESMNKVIPNGAICLFRKYSGGSRQGQIVLVEHGSLQDPETRYTVKEYHSTKHHGVDGEWLHETITLRPRSDDPRFKDITLKEDEAGLLKVIGVFAQLL